MSILRNIITFLIVAPLAIIGIIAAAWPILDPVFMIVSGVITIVLLYPAASLAILALAFIAYQSYRNANATKNQQPKI